MTLTTLPRRLAALAAALALFVPAAHAGAQNGNPLDPPARGNAPAADELPAVLKVGARITYHVGDAVSRMPQPGGGARSGGGVAWYQLDVIAVAPGFIAADARSYLIGDAQNNVATASTVQAVTGDGTTLGDVWIHPRRLREIREEQTQTRRVVRGPYELDGRTFNAVQIQQSGRDGTSNEAWDLDTGLLLFRGSTSDAGGGGANVTTHAKFVGVRQVSLPWAAEPPPPWVGQVRRIEYQGGQRMVLPDNGLPPLPGTAASVAYDLEPAARDGGGAAACVTATARARFDNGPGIPPTEQTTRRHFASAMSGGLWLPPRAIAGLRVGQAIDEDPVTRRRVTFAGVQGGLAVLVERGPADRIEYAYDVNNGMLVASRTTVQMANVGQRVIDFRLATTR